MAIPKKVINFCYGMGASVVLVGALFKITHMELGPLNGNNMLTVGLLVEAFIFAISAFDPVDKEYDWSKVYPELDGGMPRTMQVAGNVGMSGAIPAATTTSAVKQAAPAYAAAQPVVAVQQPMERTLLSEKLDDILKAFATVSKTLKRQQKELHLQ
jgi:gliding motility-associated protein GldL